jgi:hypothetical protein
MAAELLSGSWRKDPPPLPASIGEAQLPLLSALLLPSGAGALAWRMLRESPLADAPEAAAFRDAFRMHALEAALHAHNIEIALGCLKKAGIAPLLLKGWTLARLYPEPALRPYGDLDLLVAPEELEAAHHALAGPELERTDVDLHTASEDLTDLPGDEVARRAVEIDAPGGPVRALAPEHQLHQLCMHQLRHGLWRPMWLVDVALLVESLPASFDWDACLSANAWAADGVRHVLALARDLLGARLDGTPLARHQAPDWLAPAVMAQWPLLTEHYYSGVPLENEMDDAARFKDAVLSRWRGPIQATVALRAPWSGVPRVAVQASDFAVRTARFARKVATPKGRGRS